MTTFVAVGSAPDGNLARARNVAVRLNGDAYIVIDEYASRDDLPYRTLVIADVADPAEFAGIDDVGLYRAHVRPQRTHPVTWAAGEPTPGVVATFAMVHHPARTHAESDAHWRDIHAPLALHHHVGMWDYRQCSVDEVVRGPEFDGFALCGFASVEDLREKFYGYPDSRDAIGNDVASFADLKRSPRRVLCTEYLAQG